jgi:hypothetical protein
VENFQKIVVGWSKLASIGARPLAESVGIDRDFYARVLNKRRDLPQEKADLLGEALGIGHDGFAPKRIQSNLCRQLEDLAAIEDLGFEVRYLAHIKSHKEINGGKSLQKYILVHFSYNGVGRFSVLRMATEKWHRLIEQLNFPELSIIKIDTTLISELNAIDETVEDLYWSELEAELGGRDLSFFAHQMQALLIKLTGRKIEQYGKRSNAKRIDRKTDLQRIAHMHTTLSEWPAAAVHYAQSHVLAPLSQEFAPATAAGIRNDHQRVFVYVATIGDTQRLTFDADMESKVDQVLIFYANTLNPQSKYEILFDGPISYLIEAAKSHHLLREGRVSLSAKDLHFLDKDTGHAHALMRRKYHGR